MRISTLYRRGLYFTLFNHYAHLDRCSVMFVQRASSIRGFR
jgi:hypothetical protein